MRTNYFNPEPMLNVPVNAPDKAKYPVVDLHNHLWGDVSAETLIEIMDSVGVKAYNNLTGNAYLSLKDNCYSIAKRPLANYIRDYVRKYPGRFFCFTLSEFAQWEDFVLFKENRFVDRFLDTLEEDVAQGAVGLKVMKELGLVFTDPDGSLVPVDDTRLYPVWKRAGELKIPVLIHVSDPMAFFMPVDDKNEHYYTLKEFPGWSFFGSRFSKAQLLEQRDHIITDFPGTIFICPHVANCAEDLMSVAKFLDDHANTYIDFSARIDELGRQPFTARDFFLRYQDRILFGVDMPVNEDIYRCYFRFLETKDEFFDYPDYIGRWGYHRWKIYGLNLPDEVLRKVYYENAVKLIPSLGDFF